MSLITRCPACGTMFKVVTDQLKVSQGWVRCGQCTEVFDASRHLLPRETAWVAASSLTSTSTSTSTDVRPDPAPSDMPGVMPAELASALAGAAAVPTSEPSQSLPEDMLLSAVVSAPLNKNADEDRTGGFDPSGSKQSQPDRELPDPSVPSATAEDADLPPPRPVLMHTATSDDTDLPADDVYALPPGFGRPDDAVAKDEDAPADAPDVSFVRDARRRAFWAKPLVRGVLAVLSLLLVAGLLLQWALQQRDTLAATAPGAAPLLRTLCVYLRCEIRSPRHIESLVIDGSTFSRVAPDAYRLSFSLKNTRGIALQIPSLEVTLTDTQDRALVRRVLSPAEFGVNASIMPAQSELAGLVTLKVAADAGSTSYSLSSSASPAVSSPLRVAGYRVLAFYPD